MVEFRVRWQREGRSPTYRIFQTEDGARRKADAILALEEIKGDIGRFEDMPDLVSPPSLQVRDVSEWHPADPAVDAPSDAARRGVGQWASSYADEYNGSGVF